MKGAIPDRHPPLMVRSARASPPCATGRARDCVLGGLLLSERIRHRDAPALAERQPAGPGRAMPRPRPRPVRVPEPGALRRGIEPHDGVRLHRDVARQDRLEDANVEGPADQDEEGDEDGPGRARDRDAPQVASVTCGLNEESRSLASGGVETGREIPRVKDGQPPGWRSGSRPCRSRASRSPCRACPSGDPYIPSAVRAKRAWGVAPRREVKPRARPRIHGELFEPGPAGRDLVRGDHRSCLGRPLPRSRRTSSGAVRRPSFSFADVCCKTQSRSQLTQCVRFSYRRRAVGTPRGPPSGTLKEST